MSDYPGSERFTDDSPFGAVIQKQADEKGDKKNKSLQDNDLKKGKIIIRRASRPSK